MIESIFESRLQSLWFHCCGMNSYYYYIYYHYDYYYLIMMSTICLIPTIKGSRQGHFRMIVMEYVGHLFVSESLVTGKK